MNKEINYTPYILLLILATLGLSAVHIYSIKASTKDCFLIKQNSELKSNSYYGSNSIAKTTNEFYLPNLRIIAKSKDDEFKGEWIGVAWISIPKELIILSTQHYTPLDDTDVVYIHSKNITSL